MFNFFTPYGILFYAFCVIMYLNDEWVVILLTMIGIVGIIFVVFMLSSVKTIRDAKEKPKNNREKKSK